MHSEEMIRAGSLSGLPLSVALSFLDIPGYWHRLQSEIAVEIDQRLKSVALNTSGRRF
jgi:hypothetical protein